MPALLNLVGQRFDRLLVVARSNATRRWECLCDCGATALVISSSLINGNTRSCGCRRVETLVQRSRTHGRSKSSEYWIWWAMKKRCMNPDDPAYANYGGRGITVCDRWIDNFSAFYEDMGPRPLGLTLERKDNDGNYEPSNCKWATRKEQANNTRPRSTLREFRGRREPLSVFAAEAGIKLRTLKARLEAKWDLEKALTAPVRDWGRP